MFVFAAVGVAVLTATAILLELREQRERYRTAREEGRTYSPKVREIVFPGIVIMLVIVSGAVMWATSRTDTPAYGAGKTMPPQVAALREFEQDYSGDNAIHTVLNDGTEVRAEAVVYWSPARGVDPRRASRVVDHAIRSATGSVIADYVAQHGPGDVKEGDDLSELSAAVTREAQGAVGENATIAKTHIVAVRDTSGPGRLADNPGNPDNPETGRR